MARTGEKDGKAAGTACPSPWGEERGGAPALAIARGRAAAALGLPS